MDVEKFLERHVEGFLFGDLDNMGKVPPGASGDCSYPILISVLSGMELLGALTYWGEFRARDDDEQFDWYWVQFLCKVADCYDIAGVSAVVREAVRHGIAHSYLTRGGVMVTKGRPEAHMKRCEGYPLVIDCWELAKDFMASYERHVKPILQGGSFSVGADKPSVVNLELMRRNYEAILNAYKARTDERWRSFNGTIPLWPAVESSPVPGVLGTGQPEPKLVVPRLTGSTGI